MRVECLSEAETHADALPQSTVHTLPQLLLSRCPGWPPTGPGQMGSTWSRLSSSGSSLMAAGGEGGEGRQPRLQGSPRHPRLSGQTWN